MSSFLLSNAVVFGADTKEKKEGFFDKLKNFKLSIHLPHLKKDEAKPAQPIEKPKENPADKFPDPIFYDSVYKKKPISPSYLELHNDKSYYENNHIPPILDFSYIVDDLFEMMVYYEKTAEILLILDAVQNRNDVDLNKQDKFGNTILHYAIRYHNSAIFKKLLLTRKINPNVCNYSYICPIHLAIYKDDVNEINSLVNYGANLRYANDRFEMPIITAIKIHHLNSIYALAKKYKENGILMTEIDYIVFVAKDEGLESLAKDLYLFFMLGKDFSY